MSLPGRNGVFAACLMSCFYSQATAQTPTRPSRPAEVRYDGWSSSTTSSSEPTELATALNTNKKNASSDRDVPVRQVAYFQTQGALSDLPELPGLLGGELPIRSGDTMDRAPELPDYGGGVTTAGGSGQVLPPPSQVLPPNVELQRGNAELRPIDPAQRMGAAQGQLGGPPQNQVANGLPFVTPPPKTGRYPTSPYLGPRYQLTNYQLRTVPAQTVAAQTGLSVPDAMAAAAQPPVLPQNRNVVGIHPTAYQQCAPGAGVNYPATGAVPGTGVPPTYPANLTPGLYSPNNSGYSPLFSLGQENYNVMLGRGLIGQPTVYVPGQPFRNFFRYISP